MNAQLIPKQPRRKRQPTSAQLREQLAAAADRIMELEAENAVLRQKNEAAVAMVWERSWIGRLTTWVRARLTPDHQ